MSRSTRHRRTDHGLACTERIVISVCVLLGAPLLLGNLLMLAWICGGGLYGGGTRWSAPMVVTFASIMVLIVIIARGPREPDKTRLDPRGQSAEGRGATSSG